MTVLAESKSRKLCRRCPDARCCAFPDHLDLAGCLSLSASEASSAETGSAGRAAHFPCSKQTLGLHAAQISEPFLFCSLWISAVAEVELILLTETRKKHPRFCSAHCHSFQGNSSACWPGIQLPVLSDRAASAAEPAAHPDQCPQD